MKKIFSSLLLSLSLLMLASCDMSRPVEQSEYQKENEAYIAEIAKNSSYTSIYFLNEDQPIYYKVIQSAPASDNPEYPFQNSTVEMTLSGRLISGQIFQKEETMELAVSDLVKGMQIALQKMNVGDSWEVVLPWQYGYGRYSYRGLIPGFSTLIFDVKLERVVEK
ncbi:MAG: FKBP-type peptidyl-prolyl cis-trans isomerase [Porphyromonas sp.]|nr:FKBP-type peptidyl-prolyl cis-trans isomerase [Porphyromonas sp.]